MQDGFITIDTTDGPMQAFVAYPAHPGQHPGLIVIPEAFGVNHYIQNTCRHLADEGFVALSPEIYHRDGPHVDLGYTDMKPVMDHLSRLTNEGLTTDITAALERLRHLHGVHEEHMGVVGFCVGGFGAFLAACRIPTQAYVAFYGGGIVHGREGFKIQPILGEAASISAPILMFFGAQDQSITAADVAAIDANLKAQGITHEIKVYDDAGHGFMCDERASYRPDDARDAWKRMVAWFNRCLT